MRLKPFLITFLIILLFLGCAVNRNFNQLNSLAYGIVVEKKSVQLKDDGRGSVAGGLLGGILGHQVGGGLGKDLATIGGAIAGAMVGAELNKEVGSELTIALDGGGYIVTTIQDGSFNLNDRVKIIFNNSEVKRVEHY